MSAETGAMYAERETTLPADVRDGIERALAVDPAEMVETVLATDGGEVVGHAALRPFEDALEVKKVFVPLEHRGRGISRLIMLDLERRARDRGVTRLVLQTGTLQLAAIALYESLGYERIPAYGLYAVIPFEVCYEKALA